MLRSDKKGDLLLRYGPNYSYHVGTRKDDMKIKKYGSYRHLGAVTWTLGPQVQSTDYIVPLRPADTKEKKKRTKKTKNYK
jgi:hypothetical protein